MSGDHNMYQKDKSYLDFECPRCGHCCQAAGEEHMTKLEAWKAWCESAGTPDLATEFTLEQSSHGKAFSFAWERGPEQEPVAVVFDPYDAHGLQWLCQHPPHRGDKLYLSPPKREWVGLTDEEINSVRYSRDWTATLTDTTFARAIEAKLKEKNT